MKRLLLASAFLIVLSTHAKLPMPVLDDAAQAKAAETKAKAGHVAKVASYQLCAVQDRLAARYGSTTHATATVVPCMNPGALVIAAAELKPNGASSAHSPPASAVLPLGTKVPSTAGKGS
jgi:hypothetical protein